MERDIKDQGICFGRRIRELRKRANLTQEALGRAAGINFKFLGAVERADQSPSLTVILKLAEALGVPPGELFALDHLVSERDLRANVRHLLDNAEAEDLQRLVRILKALVR